jgi:hypothetical protein
MNLLRWLSLELTMETARLRPRRVDEEKRSSRLIPAIRLLRSTAQAPAQAAAMLARVRGATSTSRKLPGLILMLLASACSALGIMTRSTPFVRLPSIYRRSREQPATAETPRLPRPFAISSKQPPETLP